MTRFADIADADEDDRIAVINEQVKKGGAVVFIVDDEPGKAQRYIEKLLKLNPQIRVKKTFPGPVKGSTCVAVTILKEPLS